MVSAFWFLMGVGCGAALIAFLEWLWGDLQ